MMLLTATDSTGSDIMTGTKLIEYRITRQLLQRRHPGDVQCEQNLWVDRLIAVLAVTAGLFIIGSYFEELLWAVVAAATVSTLR
jgi:hypothetical protein